MGFYTPGTGSRAPLPERNQELVAQALENLKSLEIRSSKSRMKCLQEGG
ncbi:hypothetical protein ACP70R_018467 [Stipagrostis hirtigluma subsp. patula]